MIAKQLRHFIGRGLALLGILSAALAFTGCQTQPLYDEKYKFEDLGGVNVGKPLEFLQPGDSINVSFSGSEVAPLPFTEKIKEDGKITPPLVGTLKGSVVAAGKTPGELQKELQELYGKYYRNLTVTVTPLDRYFYVTGDVKAEGPRPYIGQTDIVKAISSCGGLTDFANRKRIKLTRANGHVEEVNYEKALEGDAEHNLEVYPGDRIFVRRRWL